MKTLLKTEIIIKRLLFLCFLGVFFTGCSNNPHPLPLHKMRADGTPWKVNYRRFPDDPRSLDPQFSYDNLGHAVIGLVYESLLEYHPFKTNPYELIPCLAQSMPERLKESNGRESYLFHLKPGLLFHDDECFLTSNGKGREVTSDDVAYIFKRMADPKVECPVYSTLQEYVVGLKDAYDTAKKSGAFDYSKPFPGIEVLDQYTFRLHLLKPYPQILYWMAMPFTAPVPHEAVEYYDGKAHDGKTRPQFKFKPVGTGAFKLVEWKRNRLIRLERNEKYRATTFPLDGWSASEETRFRPLAGKEIPFLDEIQLTIIRESIPGWLLFRQGYLESSGVSKDLFDAAITAGQELTPEYRKRGVWLYKDADPATYFLIFNMADSLLGKNKKLRQAISYAYDEALEIEIFHNDIFINAEQLLPPGVFGFQNDFKNPYKNGSLDSAKKLLAEAGYPDGVDLKTRKPLELTLDITADDAESRKQAEFQKQQIEKLGIKIKLEENLWARQQDKVDHGDFQIVSYGWSADYPDPENFFFLFYSKNAAPEGNNYSRYSNPEFDRIFEKMRTMDNSPERLQLVHQLNRVLVEDCPMVLMFYPVTFSLNQPWAPRISSNPLIASGPKYAQIDVNLRASKQIEWNRTARWPLVLLILLLVSAALFAYYWSRTHDA